MSAKHSRLTATLVWGLLLLGLLCAALAATWILAIQPDKPPRIEEPNAIRLTDSRTVDQYPRWSPDGKWIAFQRGKIDTPPGGVDPASYEIVVVNVETRDELQVSHAPDYSGSLYPTWSPEDNKLAFVQTDFSKQSSALYTVQRDGTNLTKLTDCPRPCHFPDWSSDGNRILFVMPVEKGDSGKLYTVELSQPDSITLVDIEGHSSIRWPRWASDDSELVFWTWPASIWITALVNTQPLRIQLPKAGEPTWSPDNDRIAFTVWGDKYRYPENGGDLVYVARRDGLSPEPILPGIYDGDLGQPDWSPDGKRIAAAFRRGGGASHLYIIELDEYLQP